MNCEICNDTLGSVFSNWGTKASPKCFDCSMTERALSGKNID